MRDDQKQELINRVEELGIRELFIRLGLREVRNKAGHIHCVCPFHHGADNPDAFTYSKGFGYCFTRCNRKYDIFDIVQRMLGIDFVQSIAFLADYVGMDVEKFHTIQATDDGGLNRTFLSQIKKAKANKKQVEIVPFDQNTLNSFEPRLHKLLRDEGFDSGVRDYFGLGFSQSGYLENRITIPVDAVDGTIVTVSGRSVLPKELIEERGLRRYQIWFDTDKSVTLYNISRARPHVRVTNEIIVVEGFKSVWRLHQWGYMNAVATMGTSLSDEQRKLVLKSNATVLPCGDRDKAGKLFNDTVREACAKFANVQVLDMYSLSVPEKSSIDDITKQQFEYIYGLKK